REPGAEARRARNGPSFGQDVAAAEESIERQISRVARDEIVAEVERRGRFRGRDVERVYLFAKVRRHIDGLAVRITDRHVSARAPVAQVELERVITRIAVGLL